MKAFLQNCRRMLQVARKPGKEEYLQVAKVTGVGILIVGFVGFVIMIISYLVQGTLV